jgi:Zn-dependent protease with chaperone function
MFRIIALMFLLGLCTPALADEPELYLVDAVATQSTHAPSRAMAHELEEIYADLSRVSGVKAALVWSTSGDINAFATEVEGEKIILVQEGLLESFGGDRDAVAAILGHELAHHKADHLHAGERKQKGIQVLGAILGAVVGAKMGRSSGELAGAIAGTAVGAGAGLIALKFNRSQELEADRLAVGWMIDAGYNPNGMLRVQTKLGELSGTRSRAAILSTHPTSKKRYQKAERQIERLGPSPELLATAISRLVGPDELALAEAEIAEVEQQAVASRAIPNPPAAELPAAALTPIEGIDFDTYAAIANQLTRVGETGRTAVLSQHGLDSAELERINQGYIARMQANPGLSQRYSVAYFRATEGKLAAWGRDLANSYEHDQPLQLDPPYPMSQAKVLLAELTARGAPQLDAAQVASVEKEVLAPFELSYYDYLIGHNWWSRKLTLDAMAGDTSGLQAYYDTAESPEESSPSVSIDPDKVKVGKGVYVGGKPLRTSKTSE